MTSWFRSWHGAPTDNKWLVIAAKAKVKPGIVSAVAWALLDHASQADDRGSVKEFDAETYAAFSGFDETDVQSVISAMIAKGVITDEGRLAAWEKRQPKREDETNTERVREFRKRKSVTSDNVTQCNAMEHTVTHGNHTDTDTDTDTEQNREEQNREEQTTETDTDAAWASVRSAYESNIGAFTSMSVEMVHAAYEEFGAPLVVEAIKVAVASNKRKWSYVDGILSRWRAEGKTIPQANGKPKRKMYVTNPYTGEREEVLV